MFATAQKQNVFVYDKQGVEIHVIKHKHPAYCLQFLPYHFLLASGGRGGTLQWQDISTGKIVAAHPTKKGNIFTIKQNPANAVIHVGHTAGMVTLWTPNMSEPVVSMLCHKGAVNGLAIQQDGNLMVSTGLDGYLKVWDIRKFEEVSSYLLPSRHNIKTLDISQRGVLAIGFGAHAELWKDWQTGGQSQGSSPMKMEPYMIHRAKPGQFIQSLRFCPYEDILGIGHTNGFLSFGAPGVGEPNFDSFTADVFQTKARRREATVYNLLHKIPADMIVLDPTQIGTVTKGNPQEHLQYQQEALKDYSTKFEKEKKEANRMRGKNKIGKKLARKEKANMAEKRELHKAALAQQEARPKTEPEDDDQPRSALSRFVKK